MCKSKLTALLRSDSSSVVSWHIRNAAQLYILEESVSLSDMAVRPVCWDIMASVWDWIYSKRLPHLSIPVFFSPPWATWLSAVGTLIHVKCLLRRQKLARLNLAEWADILTKSRKRRKKKKRTMRSSMYRLWLLLLFVFYDMQQNSINLN